MNVDAIMELVKQYAEEKSFNATSIERGRGEDEASEEAARCAVLAAVTALVAEPDDDQEWDRNAEKLTQEVFGPGKGINPNATSIDYLFLDDDDEDAQPQQATAQAEPVAFGDEVIDYINRYGGHCRDCSDENGVCPNRGLPCGDSKKAIRFVLEALAYGLNNGYLKNAAAQPQQATDARTCEHGCNGCEECTDDEGEA